MTHWLLNVAYLAAYAALAPWILFRRWSRGRSLGNWRERVLGLAPRRSSDRPCIWFHAVSVGEINQLESVLAALNVEMPEYEIVISTTTSTGMELARKKYGHKTLFYFPIDFSWAVRRVFNRIRPNVLLLTELELWPNVLKFAERQKIPVCVINGRLSERSFSRYRRVKPLVAPMFRRLSLACVQNQTYARRFVALGAGEQAVVVTGTVKFDGVPASVDPSRTHRLRRLAELDSQSSLMIGGSTQEPEEVILAKTYLQLRAEFPQLRLAIVPRHPHRTPQIVKQLAELGAKTALRSRFESAAPKSDEIIIVDTIGELGLWWELSSIAFVGGSFGSRGGQNMIEPAAAGSAVCFGPHTWNFQEVVELLLGADVAKVVSDEEALRDFARRCLTDPQWAKARGASARRLVLSQRGASRRTVQQIARLSSNALPTLPTREKAA